MADEQQKAKARAARFANDAKKPPPPPPKKTFAHPGGKMTTNKEEALRKYLARKGDSLNAAQKQALEDLQKKGLAPPTPPVQARELQQLLDEFEAHAPAEEMKTEKLPPHEGRERFGRRRLREGRAAQRQPRHEQGRVRRPGPGARSDFRCGCDGGARDGRRPRARGEGRRGRRRDAHCQGGAPSRTHAEDARRQQ